MTQIVQKWCEMYSKHQADRININVTVENFSNVKDKTLYYINNCYANAP